MEGSNRLMSGTWQLIDDSYTDHMIELLDVMIVDKAGPRLRNLRNNGT